jgi:hypothetical protein
MLDGVFVQRGEACDTHAHMLVNQALLLLLLLLSRALQVHEHVTAVLMMGTKGFMPNLTQQKHSCLPPPAISAFA